MGQKQPKLKLFFGLRLQFIFFFLISVRCNVHATTTFHLAEFVFGFCLVACLVVNCADFAHAVAHVSATCNVAGSTVIVPVQYEYSQ